MSIKNAGLISFMMSILLMASKFLAYRLTGSQAVFTDAMESIVNVIASGLALSALNFAHLPADKDHPYGHGKIEFFSAAFEGGLIALASILICAQAVPALLSGRAPESLGIGVFISAGAGLCNAGLGYFLLRVGKKHGSSALEASGYHVLSDCWMSLGVVAALLLVGWTHWSWIDPVAALILGGLLARTGFRLVRVSIGALLDEEDEESLQKLLQIVGKRRTSGFIQIHHVRIIRSGHYHHIDAHAVLPEFWDISMAHEREEAFEKELMREYPYKGEVHLHLDPCRRAYCRYCDLKDCAIRARPFENYRQLSIKELTSPEEPAL